MKNTFLVNNNDMSPFINKGDVVTYEPIQPNRRLYNSVYVVEYRGKKITARVQLLIKGGMLLIFDGERKTIKFEQHERMRVIFIGHVTARFFKDGEQKIDYPFSFNQLT